MPKRIQLRRTKGWRLPAGAVSVARPTRYGNPYLIHPIVDDACLEDEDHWCTYSAEEAVQKYRHAVLYPVEGQPEVPTPDDIRRELAGRDLACWCPLDQPCHVDVLLEVANRVPVY